MDKILSIIESLGTWLYNLVRFKKSPTKTDLTTSNAVAQTELSQEETANAETASAAQARTDADTSIMRNAPDANTVTTDPTASVNTDPNAHFRD